MSSQLVVKVPTLVIWGEKDTALLTGNLDGMDKFVPNLIVKRIPDGSHWVIHEKPELVNGTFAEFIQLALDAFNKERNKISLCDLLLRVSRAMH